jgi:hypothetical protein
MSMKRRLARFDQKHVYSLFLCAACLQTSLILHVPISELHAQWRPKHDRQNPHEGGVS